MNLNVALAIFKRNFVSYFSNPTGYVFICVFVLLSGVAAFWTNEFWTSNLANLDQLNAYFPLIMLVFIPAITMGIWSEERRQGTDETLLTLPVGDTDVVLGKYLAAAAIYTVSLLFSMTNILVLGVLGTATGESLLMGGPDYGLLLVNYLGYWFVGLAMLGLGMVASFLTRNLTVAFILGVLLNAPLVFLANAEGIVRDPRLAQAITQFGIGEQLQDFGNGLITFSSVVYFLSITAASLYLCMVLIGERHWQGLRNEKGQVSGAGLVPVGILVVLVAAALVGIVASFVYDIWNAQTVAEAVFDQPKIIRYLVLFGSWCLLPAVLIWFIRKGGAHYLLRALALFVVAGGLVVVAEQFDWRYDATQEQLSTIAPETRAVLAGLRSDSGTVSDELTPTPTEFAGNAALSTMDGVYVGAILRFTEGPLSDERRRVTAYGGEDRKITLESELSQAPKPGDAFVLERPPVIIEAFVSPDVPEGYVQSRRNLLTMLRQFDSLGGKQVEVRMFETLPLSREADVAEDQHGIRPRPVESTSRGSRSIEDIFLGVAVTSGLEKTVVPFFDRGIPVEYELLRSVATVSQQNRKTLGIVQTDVPLFGQFDFQSMGSSSDMPIIEELRKQYDVQQVNLEEDVDLGQYDVLLAVQPSTLPPEGLTRLTGAIEAGVPTAIFEDPFVYLSQGQVPGSSQPRRAQGGFPGMQQQAPPKGDINQLWGRLGLVYGDTDVVYHLYNPFPEFAGQFPPEFVFIGRGSQTDEPFNMDTPVTSALQTLMFVFPGSFDHLKSNPLTFTPLVRTGKLSGYTPLDGLFEMGPFGQPVGFKQERLANPDDDEYIMAGKLTGQLAGAATGEKKEIGVTVVADVDVLYPAFFAIRAQGTDASQPLETDNVTFVLNVIDDLSGDTRFIEVRNRRRTHRTLKRVEERIEVARAEVQESEAEINAEVDAQIQEFGRSLDEGIEALRNDTSLSTREKNQRLQELIEEKARLVQQRTDELNEDREAKKREINRELEIEKNQLQDSFKILAVAVPPIFPLLIALFVFLWRRSQETRGVPTRRLR